MRSPATPPSPLLCALMLAVLYAVPVVVTVRPVGVPNYDPDLWWHLRVGAWVVEHRAVPAVDPLSQGDRAWVAYSWLYEVVLYGLHARFGLAGVIGYRVVMALLVVAAVHALVARLERRFLVATALTAAAVLALAALFSERPWLVTLLFATLTLHAVVALRQQGTPPRWVWTLPLLYVVWANVHIQFVYGLFILALGCAAPLLDGWLGWEQPDSAARAHSRRWRQLLWLSLACFAATFVNPYHARLYGVVVEYATQAGAFRYVRELQALEFREPTDWVVLGLTLAAAYALGRRRPASAFEVLLLLASAWFAFRARRDLWFLVLADVVILAAGAPAEVPAGQRFRLGWPGRAALLAGLVLLAVGIAWLRGLHPEYLNQQVARVFPVGAAKVIAEKGYRGPLYNDFNWGGYLAWALPDLPVAIDGRTNLYGDRHIERFGRVWAGLPGWRDDSDLSAAGVIVAPAESPLVALLEHDNRFVRVWDDELAHVYVARWQFATGK